jgi:hypothetical protein
MNFTRKSFIKSILTILSGFGIFKSKELNKQRSNKICDIEVNKQEQGWCAWIEYPEDGSGPIYKSKMLSGNEKLGQEPWA